MADNYMKKNYSENMDLSTEELIKKVNSPMSGTIAQKVFGIGLFVVSAVVMLIIAASLNNMKLADSLNGEGIGFTLNPISAASTKRDLISVPSGTVKANPFLPYRNLGDIDKTPEIVDDVPRFDLIEPPESIGGNIEAVKVMDTVVSGILYDKYSPSAILNIEGNDYLVKTGDVVNNYKVVSIKQDSVTVKLGNNTYNAGIGEILTEGQVTFNNVSNLNKKFGGEKNEI